MEAYKKKIVIPLRKKKKEETWTSTLLKMEVNKIIKKKPTKNKKQKVEAVPGLNPSKTQINVNACRRLFRTSD